MFRGKTTNRSIIEGLLICSLIWITAPRAEAGSAARALGKNIGKAAAPSKEDGVDYFATFRKNVSLEDARQADGLRLKTITSINALLSDKKNAKNEYELTLRLGELYVERADYLRDLEIADYIKAHDAWALQPEAKRSKNSPQASYSRSENSLYQAAQTFRKIATKYPKHPRSDATIYSLARTLSRLNDDNAAQYYAQMIKNHPKSKLIPDAWLALGELHFDKHRIKEATTAYQNVMNFKTHRAYPYAVYKLGWCFYNSQGVNEKKTGENLEKSLAAFQLVVKLSDKQKASNFNLRDEALRDLVMVFAELEDTDRAWAYFKGIGETDRFYAMLERLGGMYAEAGKTGKAIETYSRLVEESPTRKNNPQIYKAMVSLYDLSNRFPDVVKTIRSMQSIFVKDSSWISKNAAEPKVLADAKSVTERTMHRYGTLFHSRGQKIKDKNLEGLAAEIYTTYLESFEKAEPAYELRYYLADIQLDQKKYAQASANFVVVAKQKPKDGKYLKDAAFNAVDAISLWAQSEKFPPVPPPGQATNPIDLPKIKKLYADSIDFYISLLPKESNGIPMRYTAAQIYFDYGHYTEALKRFDALALNHSNSKQGQAASRIMIGYFNEKTDWRSVIAYGKKFQNNKSLMQDATVKAYIENSLRTALFNSALAYEKAADHTKAAEGFIDFQRIFPSDVNADRALFNASVNQFKAGMVELSLATQKNILTQYPKSKLCPDVMANMAETFEALAQFQKSADMYKSLANAYPNDQRAALSLYNAAVLQRGINNSAAAITTFNELYKRYPNHKLAADAILESAKTSEEQGDVKSAISSYSSFASRTDMKHSDDGLFAQAKSIELRFRLDPKNEVVRKDLPKIISHLRAKNASPAPAARAIVARLLFLEQEPMVRSFHQIQLTTVKDVEAQAGHKQAKLVRLANAYEDIIALGNAEFAVASYYRLGELHEEFAKSLFSVPTPSNYSPKEASELKSQLERSAFPLKEQSYKFYETAFTQSSEVDSLSEWTVRTYEKMAALAPEKHHEMQEMTAQPGYITSKIAISSATESLAH
jgi:TolA-binding protein